MVRKTQKRWKNSPWCVR